MSRLALLTAVALLLTLSGCVVYPGHHCCWRYDYGYRAIR